VVDLSNCNCYKYHSSGQTKWLRIVKNCEGLLELFLLCNSRHFHKLVQDCVFNLNARIVLI
jgi:hypothetical protein